MADSLIPQKLNEIASSDGAGMREPTVAILREINESGRNATTFEGKKKSDYILKSEWNIVRNRVLGLIKKDDTISPTSDNPVTAYAIRKLLGQISNFPG